MGVPVAVLGDQVTGVCVAGHLIPSASGTAPAPPLPFSAPLVAGASPTVLVSGRPVLCVGASGQNTTPHAGIVDPFAVPQMQMALVLSGSTTVLAGGLPVATMSSTVQMCNALSPGTLLATGATVLVGG